MTLPHCVDVHTHVVVDLPDFASRYRDERWPAFSVVDGVGALTRDGAVVRQLRPPAWDIDQRLAEMDAAGIDVQVLSPIPPIICDWSEPERAGAWASRINHGIAEVAAKYPNRFRGLGTVPLRHPRVAVDVLDEAHGLGLAGVEVGTTAGGHELDHPELHEVFDTLQRLGLILFVHPLILGASTGWTERIAGLETTFGLGMTTDTAIAAARLVFGGVTERFPGLRICLSHGGGTFFWALPRIAHLWDRAGERPATRELISGLYTDSVVYRPENLAYLCSTIGADHVLFGTDYPLPAQDDLAGTMLATLSETEATLVRGQNARQLFTD